MVRAALGLTRSFPSAHSRVTGLDGKGDLRGIGDLAVQNQTVATAAGLIDTQRQWNRTG
jgi:hypothetical protein